MTMAAIYDPLNIESYEIRILNLRPGPLGSKIECFLEKESLVDSTTYAALSYCWGDPTETREIFVNHAAKQVTTSLEHALQRLRDLGVERLWADALCINQEDAQEKSRQIRNMREIYSKANPTYAWLGGKSQDRAVDGMKFLG